ncbi:MAG: chondroitinase-B domain-containing protein [Alphaproteobacteria bacterium]
MPGDVITLAPGRYSLERVRIRRLGAKGRPITLRADKKGSVFLRSRGVVLFDIRAAYWTFENFDIRGQCIPQKSVSTHSSSTAMRTMSLSATIEFGTLTLP